MNALILAAGTGSRLLSATRELPKALVPVRGRPLIEYTLDFARAMGCSEISVVGGFYFDKLQQHLQPIGASLRIFENREFLKGNALSLMAALTAQNDAFILLNVDHIYPKRLALKIAENVPHRTSITAFVDFDRPLGDDDMKVQLAAAHAGRRAARVIQKISKNLHEFDAGYIGMAYVPQQQLTRYKSAAQAVVEQDESAVVEHILQWLIDHGHPPEIFDASGIRWLEVDNQNDLRNAERILKNVDNYLD